MKEQLRLLFTNDKVSLSFKSIKKYLNIGKQHINPIFDTCVIKILSSSTKNT